MEVRVAKFPTESSLENRWCGSPKGGWSPQKDISDPYMPKFSFFIAFLLSFFTKKLKFSKTRALALLEFYALLFFENWLKLQNNLGHFSKDLLFLHKNDVELI